MKIGHLYAGALALNLAGFSFVAGLAALVGVETNTYAILMRVVILGLSVLLVLISLGRGSFNFARGLFWLPLLVFWGAYTLRLVNDTIWTSAPLSKPPADYWIWAFGTCFIPMLAMLTRPDLNTVERAYRWIVPMFLMAGVSVLLAGTSMTGDGGWGSYNSGRMRLESLNPISVGHLGVSMLLLAAWPVLRSRGRMVRRAWLWTAAGGGVGLYLMVSAASRGPIVALILVFLFYFLTQRLKRVWRPVLMAGVILVSTYSLASRFENAGTFQLISRMEAAIGSGDGATIARQDSIGGALRQFASSPLYGDAIVEARTHFYPHNLIVESLMATGLIGGLPFLVILLIGVHAAYRVLRLQSEHGWVALILVQQVVAAQFSGGLYNSTMMWTFLGATISLHLGVKTALRGAKISSASIIKSDF